MPRRFAGTTKRALLKAQKRGWQTKIIALHSSLLRLLGRSGLLLVTPLDFFRRHIFDVRSEPPLVALRVFDSTGSVSIRLVRGFSNRLSACRERALVNGINVLDIQVEHGRSRRPLITRLTDHDHRVADTHFGVHHAALVVAMAIFFLCAERLFQKINLRFCIRHRQVRRDGVIAIRNWFDCHDFASRVSGFALARSTAFSLRRLPQSYDVAIGIREPGKLALRKRYDGHQSFAAKRCRFVQIALHIIDFNVDRDVIVRLMTESGDVSVDAAARRSVDNRCWPGLLRAPVKKLGEELGGARFVAAPNFEMNDRTTHERLPSIKAPTFYSSFEFIVSGFELQLRETDGSVSVTSLTSGWKPGIFESFAGNPKLLYSIHMHLFINGDERVVAGPLPLAELIEQLGMKGDRVAVELNHEIIARAQWPETKLKDGDRLEIVHFVGGG